MHENYIATNSRLSYDVQRSLLEGDQSDDTESATMNDEEINAIALRADDEIVQLQNRDFDDLAMAAHRDVWMMKDLYISGYR
jgi:hypothetical protein